MTCGSRHIKEQLDRTGAYKLGNGNNILTPKLVDGRPTFYIHFRNGTTDMSWDKLLHVGERACAEFERVFGGIEWKLSEELVEGHPQLYFGYNGDPLIPQAFGDNTIAYMYYAGYGMDGQAYFNDDMLFGDVNDGKFQYLVRVIIHEILHGLGFDHSDDSEDLHYWANKIGYNNIAISEDLAQGIKDQYGHLMPDMMDTPSSDIPDALHQIFYEKKRFNRRPDKQSLQAMAQALNIDGTGSRRALENSIWQRIK